MRRPLTILLAIGAVGAAMPSPAASAPAVATLSPALGLRIDGRLWRQHAGIFVAAAGDVNGDGLADVLVGTSESHRERVPWNAYVVFGRRGRAGRVVRLDRLGAAGLRLVTRAVPGFRGGAGAGDVNGDGLADLVLATGTGSPGRVAIVVDGRRRGGTLNVDRLGTGGFAVRGAAGADLGAAVAGAGDIDRDGFADVLIAEPQYVPPGGQFGTGRVVLVFGARRTGTLDTSTLGARGAVVIGPGPFPATLGPNDQRLYSVGFGDALAGPGDVDGDGRPDVVIGAPYLGGREGGAFVITDLGRGLTIDLRGPRHAGWYRIDGSGGNAHGWSVAGAGDQNGDGIDDFLVGGYAGGPFTSGSSGPSAAFIVRGRADPTDVALAQLGGVGNVLSDLTGGDRAGQSVAGVGDVTGDGRPDVLIGAPLADPGGVRGAGSAFLVPGGSLPPSVDLRAMTRPGTVRYDGSARFDTAGWSVAGLGDVNGDGIPDMAVGAPRTDTLSQQSGSTYVIYGSKERAR